MVWDYVLGASIAVGLGASAYSWWTACRKIDDNWDLFSAQAEIPPPKCYGSDAVMHPQQNAENDCEHCHAYDDCYTLAEIYEGDYADENR